ncbi:MAG: hypothetical protein QOD42_3810 [Sphingomonadales bacterium]|jgi:hypothetical protein|nr:hypothetical protein [Sphingomonadales bacterium]
MAEDRNGFWLLAAGALLFAVGFLLGLEWLKLDEKLAWLEPPVLVALCTILFGIPYVLREFWRQTNWALVAYLLILIPLFHFLAADTLLYVSNALSEAAGQIAAQAAAAAEMGEAVQVPPDPAAIIHLGAGLMAGFVGAIGPLLAVGLLRWLRRPGASPLLFIAALLTLTWWSGLGMRLVGEDAYDAVTLIALVFLPWQILLAFFLSHLLRASPPKAPPAPAPAPAQ